MLTLSAFLSFLVSFTFAFSCTYATKTVQGVNSSWGCIPAALGCGAVVCRSAHLHLHSHLCYCLAHSDVGNASLQGAC